MASTTRRPSAAADRRAAVENRILSAVEELLKGGTTCTELGVERIAAAGGLSRSTFHLHFRDKVDVLLRVIASVKAASSRPGRSGTRTRTGWTAWPAPTSR